MRPEVIEIFGNVSTPIDTLAISDLSVKIFYGDRLRGTPTSRAEGGNARGVAEYSDFRPIEFGNVTG